MSSAPQDLLRSLPSVDTVLRELPEADACPGVPHRLLVEAVREAVAEIRECLVAGTCGVSPNRDMIHAQIRAAAHRRLTAVRGPHYRRAVNATGIILHTGLGRAVLPAAAIRQIADELAGYSVLQVDIDQGKRSRRDTRIEWLLQRLTGAEAATVVNNNAAATSIVLNTVGRGREIIVSRGQLVEIGGAFRLPDVMAFSGARLVEVGTTNKTHARDYERAINENTTAILRVHPSNYKIVGFTAEVPLDELVSIAHAHNLTMIDDVGAGALIDYSRLGLPDEPTLPGSIRAGADVVLSSADKLIGGPQGGIILGKAAIIDAVRKNPFARIVRVDKLTLAALEATLTLFLDEAAAIEQVPTLRMMLRDPHSITGTARHIVEQFRLALPDAPVRVIEGHSQMGSGSLPGFDLPTTLVAIEPTDREAEALGRQLREGAPPVFTRIQKGAVVIDPRTLLDGEERIVIEQLVAILRRK